LVTNGKREELVNGGKYDRFQALGSRLARKRSRIPHLDLVYDSDFEGKRNPRVLEGRVEGLLEREQKPMKKLSVVRETTTSAKICIVLSAFLLGVAFFGVYLSTVRPPVDEEASGAASVTTTEVEGIL